MVAASSMIVVLHLIVLAKLYHGLVRCTCFALEFCPRLWDELTPVVFFLWHLPFRVRLKARNHNKRGKIVTGNYQIYVEVNL